MSTFVTVVLIVAGVTLLAMALSSGVVSLRNKLFRLYISLRPKRVVLLLSEWYPTLDIQVSEGPALALMPVPWTVEQAILYANEQSQRISACLVPTVSAKTGLVDANKLHAQAIAQFRVTGLLEGEKALAQIREFQNQSASTAEVETFRPELISKTVNEAMRNSMRQCLFDKPFESNLVTLIRYLKEPEDLRREGQKIIQQLLVERNGGEDDRIRLENFLNQFINRRFQIGEEE